MTLSRAKPATIASGPLGKSTCGIRDQGPRKRLDGKDSRQLLETTSGWNPRGIGLIGDTDLREIYLGVATLVRRGTSNKDKKLAVPELP